MIASVAMIGWPRATEGGVVANYGYDLIDQLTSETKTALSYSATYTYDANGNRSTRTVNGVTENYAYDNADKLTGITGGARPRTFGYDLAGRTTSIVEAAGTTTLNYDYDGRVTSIGYIGGGSDAFTYNGSGARITSSGTNGSNTFRRNGVGVTSPLMSDGVSQYTPGTSVRTGSTSKFQHSGLKNTTDQTDSSQAVTASKHYDAFGSLISSSGTWSGVHGYAGTSGYQEDGNGLKLLGNRYYDSDTGRFLSQDPIKDGKNWYSYCSNSPIASADPTGLQLAHMLSAAGAFNRVKRADGVYEMAIVHGDLSGGLIFYEDNIERYWLGYFTGTLGKRVNVSGHFDNPTVKELEQVFDNYDIVLIVCHSASGSLGLGGGNIYNASITDDYAASRFGRRNVEYLILATCEGTKGAEYGYISKWVWGSQEKCFYRQLYNGTGGAWSLNLDLPVWKGIPPLGRRR